MNKREMERLLDLLAKMSEQTWVNGQERDAIAQLRDRLWERV